MNTCIVCGGSFQPQSNCPYCNFPEITVLGDKAVLDEMAAGYRKEYLADIRLGVMYTIWKADGDTPVSYTHLDVYKRQALRYHFAAWAMSSGIPIPQA